MIFSKSIKPFCVALSILLVCAALSGCGSVDITKTTSNYYDPTNPNTVEILMTKPNKAYEELGTINATNFRVTDTAKMHNALRAKAAPLGADAIIITSSGIAENSQWVIGVAIRYTSASK